MPRAVMRAEIIATAERVFLRNGIRNTLLSHIAEELGLGRAALYHYFRSREDLVSATIETATRRFLLFPDSSEELSLAATISNVVNSLVNAVNTSPADVRFLMSALLEQLDDPIENQQMRRAVTDFRASTARALELGKQRGEVRSDVDTNDEANRFLADLIGRELLIVLDPEFDFGSSATRVLDEFLARVSIK